MKTKVLAIAILATIAAYASANAADLPPPPTVYKAPPPPAYTWTGCYVGGGAGYGWWNQNSFVQLGGAPVTASITTGGRGWFGQGQGGCDYQLNPVFFNTPLVIGVFGDYEGGSISGTSSFPGVVGTETENASWAAGGRIGALITPRVLTYFDGGWTQAKFSSVGYNLAIAGGGPVGLSLAAQTYNGWFIGGGFEYALDWLPISGLFLKTEYRYSQYNTANVPITGTPGGGLVVPAGIALNSQKATEMVSTELVWRFNWFGR
ncbi:MAG: porin family protein [Xanthobacteraceae bacterium]